MNRRLLLLSYSFPPASAPEAFLSAKRLGNVPGAEVDVICLQPEGDIRPDHSLNSYVQERFRQVERLPLPPALHKLVGGRSRMAARVPGLYHIVNRIALRAALQREPDRYDAMVTWSQWHSVHLVGLALKRRFPKLAWIAHFSDPWVDNPFSIYDPIRRAFDRHLERKVFESADVLSFTSRETIDLVFVGPRARYRDRTIELPHIFDPVLYSAAPPPPSGRLVVRSFGAFYRARSPEPLFRALAILRARERAPFDTITVEMYGSMPAHFLESAALRALPPDTVRVLPAVDYRSALAIMQSADLLLNIDAPFASSPFLPSKLVDYIGAGRPIFGITPPGAASRVIRNIGGWVTAPDQPDSIAAGLAAALRAIESRRAMPWGDQAISESYSAVVAGPRFRQIVEQAIASSA